MAHTKPDWADIFWSYGTRGAERRDAFLRDAADWVKVAELSYYDYDWAILRAYYSPSARRYFWYGDRGCSCNDWKDDINSPADFESGDRRALIRALREFGPEEGRGRYYGLTPDDTNAAIRAVTLFKENA